MPDFSAKMHQIQFWVGDPRSTQAQTQTPLEELTALPQTT